MKTELIQKRGLNLRKFTLSSDKIIVESRSQRGNNRYEVRIERLGTDLHYHSESKRPYRIGVFIFGIFFCILLGFYFMGKIKTSEIGSITAIYALIAIILLFRRFDDDIYLVGGNTNIVFYRTKPSEEKVLEFIDEIRATQKAYLKAKYTEFDNMTSEEEFYARLNWLRNQSIITTEEYQDYKNSFDLLRLLK